MPGPRDLLPFVQQVAALRSSPLSIGTFPAEPAGTEFEHRNRRARAFCTRSMGVTADGLFLSSHTFHSHARIYVKLMRCAAATTGFSAIALAHRSLGLKQPLS